MTYSWRTVTFYGGSGGICLNTWRIQWYVTQLKRMSLHGYNTRSRVPTSDQQGTRSAGTTQTWLESVPELDKWTAMKKTHTSYHGLTIFYWNGILLLKHHTKMPISQVQTQKLWIMPNGLTHCGWIQTLTAWANLTNMNKAPLRLQRMIVKCIPVDTECKQLKHKFWNY